MLQGDQLHMAVFSVNLLTVTCPMYDSVHVCTGQSLLTWYQKNTAMFNWSPYTYINNNPKHSITVSLSFGVGRA